MSWTWKYCPVCKQPVTRTSGDKIAPHMDSIGRDICPATGEPYRIAVTGRRGKVA